MQTGSRRCNENARSFAREKNDHSVSRSVCENQIKFFNRRLRRDASRKKPEFLLDACLKFKARDVFFLLFNILPTRHAEEDQTWYFNVSCYAFRLRSTSALKCNNEMNNRAAIKIQKHSRWTFDEHASEKFTTLSKLTKNLLVPIDRKNPRNFSTANHARSEISPIVPRDDSIW